MTQRYTIGDIRRANIAAGFHFFDSGAMRFFDSRIASTPYHGVGGVYFITSEQFHGSGGESRPRKFTVRRFDPSTGDVDTAGRFNEIGDIHTARMEARRWSRGDSPRKDAA